MRQISEILNKSSFSAKDLVYLLNTEGEEMLLLFKRALEVKQQYLGNKVFFRGLIEFSNVCQKDCLYCGIRKSNNEVNRYTLTDKEILNAVSFAYENHYGSIVLQSGEVSTKSFVKRIEKLLLQIKLLYEDKLRITLSMGEQERNVYQRWFDAGAHRYLLRIETTNENLYNRIHPGDSLHRFNHRLDCLTWLKEVGYQTGTGVMIGLPFQTLEDLANDLLFFCQFDIDMVGMGPYLEHTQTPLYQFRDLLLNKQQRFELSLKMIASLRLLMKDINIAASTALQAIDPIGREKAVRAGANVIMPNITPGLYRNDYELYENKPCIKQEPAQCLECLDARFSLTDSEIGYCEWGDSKHYKNRLRLKS